MTRKSQNSAQGSHEGRKEEVERQRDSRRRDKDHLHSQLKKEVINESVIERHRQRSERQESAAVLQSLSSHFVSTQSQ